MEKDYKILMDNFLANLEKSKPADISKMDASTKIEYLKTKEKLISTIEEYFKFQDPMFSRISATAMAQSLEKSYNAIKSTLQYMERMAAFEEFLDNTFDEEDEPPLD